MTTNTRRDNDLTCLMQWMHGVRQLRISLLVPLAKYADLTKYSSIVIVTCWCHWYKTITSAPVCGFILPVTGCNISFGARGLRSAAPAIWNSLPSNVRSCETLTTFRRHLKSHLFHSAFAVATASELVISHFFKTQPKISGPNPTHKSLHPTQPYPYHRHLVWHIRLYRKLPVNM